MILRDDFREFHAKMTFSSFSEWPLINLSIIHRPVSAESYLLIGHDDENRALKA